MPVAAASATPSEGYRAYLDGLRVVAVYLVVLFHSGSDRFSAGYVGVDVFFVLSGFLVTQLLLRDLSSDGSISYRRFYARRFRRLLPAAFVVLVASALVYSALASPIEVAASKGGFQAAFLYVTNWYFIRQAGDYFAADPATNPVLQFWSLAVEEQFYLAWPLLLGGLWLLARRFDVRRWQVLRGVVAVGALASLLWAWSLRSSDPSRAYYGTDARAYQLMAGALIALTPTLVTRLAGFARPARWVGLASIVTIGILASSWISLDAIGRGALVTLATALAIVALEVADGGVAQRVLSLAPIVYLGRISYGTYLWHWPVILVLARSFDLSVVSTIAFTTVVATALASLSFEVLERPVRFSAVLDRFRTPVIVGGLALSAVSALIIIPAVLDPSRTTSVAAVAGPRIPTTSFSAVPADLDFAALKADFPPQSACYQQSPDVCTLRVGSGPHIALIGDSHAQMVIPTLTAMADRYDLTLSVSVQFVCPWQRDLYAVTLVNPNQRLKACQKAKDDLYDRVIPALDPDVVVVMNRGYEVPNQEPQYRGPDGQPLAASAPEFDDWLEQTTTDSLAELGAGGRKVVMLEPIPYGVLNPLTCLSEAVTVAECRYVVDPTPTSVERLYRRLAADDDQVWSVDLDRLVCPYLPICDPIVDELVVKADWTHLTSTFARALAPAIGSYFAANGITPP